MTDKEKFEAWFDRDCEFIKSSASADNLAWIKHGYWTAWQAALASQQPADDGWIEWAGGENPQGVRIS